MQNIGDLVSTLDSHVMRTLNAFTFSDSPLAWGPELDQIFSDIYASVVRGSKEDIRTVGLGFRKQSRVAGLFHHLEDLVSRTNKLRLILSVVDLLTQYPSGVALFEPAERTRIRFDLPNLRCTVRSIMTRFTSWQDELEDALSTFALFEESEQTLEELLASLSDTIPSTFISEGRDLIDQLVSLWAERRTVAGRAASLAPENQEFQQLLDLLNHQREDQDSIIRSFAVLITRIIDTPPFRFAGLDFNPHQLLEADELYRRLCVRRMDLHEEIQRVETMLDHMMNAVGVVQD